MSTINFLKLFLALLLVAGCSKWPSVPENARDISEIPLSLVDKLAGVYRITEMGPQSEWRKNSHPKYLILLPALEKTRDGRASEIVWHSTFVGEQGQNSDIEVEGWPMVDFDGETLRSWKRSDGTFEYQGSFRHVKDKEWGVAENILRTGRLGTEIRRLAAQLTHVPMVLSYSMEHTDRTLAFSESQAILVRVLASHVRDIENFAYRAKPLSVFFWNGIRAGRNEIKIGPRLEIPISFEGTGEDLIARFRAYRP